MLVVEPCKALPRIRLISPARRTLQKYTPFLPHAVSCCGTSAEVCKNLIILPTKLFCVTFVIRVINRTKFLNILSAWDKERIEGHRKTKLKVCSGGFCCMLHAIGQREQYAVTNVLRTVRWVENCCTCGLTVYDVHILMIWLYAYWNNSNYLDQWWMYMYVLHIHKIHGAQTSEVRELTGHKPLYPSPFR